MAGYHGGNMSAAHYRPSLFFAASLSLLLTACSSSAPRVDAAGEPLPPPPPPATQTAAASHAGDEIDTEATLWTVLGLAKEESKRDPGPKTGDSVSPILWQAAHDTLNFVQIASEDPMTGALVTDWYSPKDKPTERFRLNIFILARALRSDSIAVTVERQERSPSGQWVPSTVDREVASNLEASILQRARQIRRSRPVAS